MICPKCNKEIPYDHNLCGYCGNPIREKCPECGEMEEIGRAVCETKVQSIKEQAAMFAKQKVPFGKIKPFLFLWVACLVLSVLLPLFVALYTDNLKWLWGFVSFPIIYLPAFWVSDWFFDQRKKAKKDFFRLHPDLAEMIKKAEGEKK